MNTLYYNMVCKITIGNIVTDAVSSVLIDTSIKKLSDTAKIVLPREFSRVVKDGKKTTFVGQNIKNFIKVNDTVSISLGYDQDIVEEFTGYVTQIGADIPLVITCEDEMSQLRKSNFVKVFETVKLKELLQFIAPNYEYDIIDNINLGKFTINNASAYKVLEELRKNYGLHSRFVKKVLHVGFPISIQPQKIHEINLNRNVRAKSSDLKFVKKEDLKLLLKGTSIVSKTGERITADFGENGGAQRTLHFIDKTKSELNELLEKNYKSLNFDGYQGKIPTWCLPRTKAGDGVAIIDPNYPNSERDGIYLIEGVNIKFDKTNGILRDNKLSLQL